MRSGGGLGTAGVGGKSGHEAAAAALCGSLARHRLARPVSESVSHERQGRRWLRPLASHVTPRFHHVASGVAPEPSRVVHGGKKKTTASADANSMTSEIVFFCVPRFDFLRFDPFHPPERTPPSEPPTPAPPCWMAFFEDSFPGFPCQISAFYLQPCRSDRCSL